MKLSIFFPLFALVLAYGALGQARPDDVYVQYVDNEPEIATVGVGLGQNFGGIGMNGTYYLSPNAGMFVGIGYAFAGTGFNAGLKLRALPEKMNARPYLIAMYGYNASIAVLDARQFNNFFYGASVGLGIDLYNPNKEAYWNLRLTVPFRSSEVKDYIQMLEDEHGIIFNNELLPITFSIGYNFMVE